MQMRAQTGRGMFVRMVAIIVVGGQLLTNETFKASRSLIRSAANQFAGSNGMVDRDRIEPVLCQQTFVSQRPANAG